MKIPCNFAACNGEATVLMNFKSECGHTVNVNVPVCSKHAVPGTSPMPHTCKTCGQRVYVIRELA